MAQKIKIRRATAWDVIEIAKLLLKGAMEQSETVWYPTPSKSHAKKIGSVLALIDKGLVVVAEQEVDGRIVAAVGMVITQADWSDDWQLMNEWIYILPEFRATDIFDNLMSAVEAWADDNRDPTTGQGLAALMGVWTGDSAELKDQLMQRRGWQYAGGNFVRPPYEHDEENHAADVDTDVARTG